MTKTKNPKRLYNIILFCLFWVLPAADKASADSQGASQKAREHYLAGQALLKEEKFGAADAEFKKAQELLSNQSAEPAEASGIPLASAASQEPEKSPNPDLYYNQAIGHLTDKQYRLAAEKLKTVIRLNPKDKDAYYNLGVIYDSYLQDKKAALEYYGQYLKCAPRAQDAASVRLWMQEAKKELKQDD